MEREILEGIEGKRHLEKDIDREKEGDKNAYIEG